MKNRFIVLSASLLLAISPSLAASKAPVTKKSSSQPAKSAKAPVQKAKPTSPPMLQDFTFMGNRIGDPAEEVIKRAFKPDEQQYIQECLSALKAEGESHCTDYNLEFIDFRRSFLSYEFFNKQFSGFTLSFPLNAYFDVKPMLVGKYGEPHKKEVNIVHNSMGASFEQFVSTWNTPHGPMTLYYCYPNLETGYLMLQDQTVNDQIKEIEKEKLKEKGKSIF